VTLRAILSSALVAAGICSCICDEDIRAQVIEETAVVSVGATEITVEVARTSAQRERGLRYRQCGEPAMALIADARSPLPVWQCEVPIQLDILFIRAGTVVEAVAGAPPCSAPCEQCPTYGEGIAVDAVLEVVAGRLPAADLRPGTLVQGLAP